MDEPCQIYLKVPGEWKVATSLKPEGNYFIAEDYHQLADSPFIASPSLQQNQYEVAGKIFNIWINGECRPDWNRILKDFHAFTEVQFNLMKEFPFNEYHFLLQVLPYSFYHGVEHLHSTVIAIGPGYDLMNENVYNELLGVASHELFHVWNIKTIRPDEMMPYNYTAENYSRSGYIYEGVTTYYGDLFLARAGIFSTEQYLHEISIRLQKHMDNSGRFNFSVAQSSFDTWLDGYVPGIPGRKTSIYDEGSLLALLLDLIIRQCTSNTKSLDDVMQILNLEFAKKEKGYSPGDYQKIAEKVCGKKLDSFFDGFVNKAVSYDSLLCEMLEFAGCENH